MLINSKIFDKAGIPFYNKVLKTASAAQKATASNIANVSTPGYRAKSVDFKSEMRKFLSQKSTIVPTATDPKHIAIGGTNDRVRVSEPQPARDAGPVNDVNVEQEMMNLSENQLLYEFGAKKLARTFGILRAAIRGRNQ